MNRPGDLRAWAAALLLAPAFARAQATTPLAWDADVFAAMRGRLAESDTPPTPTSRPTAPEDPDARARALFARTLVVGASVSSDFRTASPGRRVARRLGTEGSLVEKARAGASGASIVPTLTDDDFATATVVIGVDLFYWDSRRDCAGGLAAVDAFFKLAAVHRTPVVIGNVPALRAGPFGGGGACRDPLNARIAAACAAAPGCALLDLDKLWSQAAAAGGLKIDGRRYTSAELLPDGLHPSDVASESIAERIVALVDETPDPAKR